LVSTNFLLFIYYSPWVEVLLGINKIVFRLPVAHRESLKQWLSAVSRKVTWMELYSDYHDGWLRTACNWGLENVLLDSKMLQKCSATLRIPPHHTPTSNEHRQLYPLTD